MQTITTIGLDIAKSVFQIHGVDGGRSSGHPPVSLNANAALIWTTLRGVGFVVLGFSG